MAVKKGFTLIEIILVLIIVGIAIAFGVPSFINYIELTKAQTAQNNLLAIAAAQQKYSEDNSAYCTTTTPWSSPAPLCGDSVQDLNANLHFSMDLSPFSYSCTALSSFTCTASDGTTTLSIAYGGAVQCTAGPASVCNAINTE